MERWARVGRGAAAASFATFFAAFSHAVAGSTAPGAVGVVIAFAFALLVCTALAGRRLSLPRLVVGVLTSQALFHLLFGVGAGDPRIDWSQHLGHHGEVVGTLPLGIAAPAQAPVHAAHDGAWMWMAHVVAAAATIVAARWGARALAALAALVDLGLRLVVRRAASLVPVETPGVRAAVVAIVPEWAPRARLLLGRMRHRGPPARLALHSSLA